MNAHRSTRTFAAFMVPAILGLLAPHASAEVPRWIAAPEDWPTDHPLWVSADEAAPNGFLRWELFDAHQQEWFRRNLELNAKARTESSGEDSDERCINQIVVSGTASHRWTSKELLERSAVVYSAQIEDAAPGFLNGNLGTMVEVTVRELLKEPTKGTPLSKFFVFYPSAEIPVEGTYLCSRDVREPASPKLGGVLILASRKPQPEWPEQRIFVANDTEIFFDSVKGNLSAPHGYGMVDIAAFSLEQALRVEGGLGGAP